MILNFFSRGHGRKIEVQGVRQQGQWSQSLSDVNWELLQLCEGALTQRGSYDLAMAGILIGSALEAYKGDWKAIHGSLEAIGDV